ncbi:MAG: DUF2764 family protein [Alistipes sp.]|nr:DUF2764 family protein [Alistipes sp.]MBQ2393592.1 DUF2764 family protein [Alistipes sp.]MBQ5718094.1 DUF2764 family protein [Alistipes sp.]
MFAQNYYSLVSGLREYTLDSDRKGFDPLAIRAEVLEELSSSDARQVELLYTYYDCENLAARRAGRTAHNALGNLTAEQIHEELQHPSLLPEELQQVVRAFADPEGEDAEEVNTTQRFEKALFAAYYALCQRKGSRFLKSWSAFDCNLRNVTAALTARELGRSVEEVTVGGGEIVEQLERSSASDFGLRGELSYIDTLIAALQDEQNIIEKEHKVDMIRWNESLELSVFDYFDLNAILAYLVRLNIVARWSLLDAERGRELFNRLMQELDGKALIK